MIELLCVRQVELTCYGVVFNIVAVLAIKKSTLVVSEILPGIWRENGYGLLWVRGVGDIDYLTHNPIAALSAQSSDLHVGDSR